MTTQNTKPTITVATVLPICEVCKQAGKFGPQWLVYVEGQNAPVKVHKPCGETLLASKPENVEARLVPSRELRDIWNKQRAEKTARSFWEQKFAQARPLSKPAVHPAPAETAQVA